ncbi:MAG: hypothetical protein AAFQ94_24550 [Bacteroidota bacterium]
MRIFLLIAFTAAFISCSDIKIESKYSDNSKVIELVLSYDTLDINVDFLPFYTRYLFYEQNDQLHFLGFNHLSHSFDILNLDTKELRSLQLERDGRNGIYSVGVFDYQDGQVLFKGVKNSIYNYSIGSGEVTLYKKAGLPERYQLGKRINNSQFESLAVSPDGANAVHKLYSLDYVTKSAANIYSNEYYNTYVFRREGEDLALNIPYPATEDIDNESYGDLDVMSFAFVSADQFAVGFSYSDVIYKVDVSSGKIVATIKNISGLELPEKLSGNDIKDYGQIDKHMRYQPHFKPIRYHSDQRILYRYYKGKSNTGSFYDFSNSKLLLYNEDLDIIYNEKTADNIYPRLFPYAKGFIGLARNRDLEDKLIFAKYEFKR